MRIAVSLTRKSSPSEHSIVREKPTRTNKFVRGTEDKTDLRMDSTKPARRLWPSRGWGTGDSPDSMGDGGSLTMLSLLRGGGFDALGRKGQKCKEIGELLRVQILFQTFRHERLAA